MTAHLRLSICALVVSSPAVLAAQPAPLPAEPQSLVARIATTSQVVAGLREKTFTAKTCAAEQGDLVCDCLRGDQGRYEQWRAGHADGVVFVHGTAFVSAKSATLVDDTWVLQDLWYVDHGSPLHADQAHISPAGASLSVVTWHDSTDLPPLTCGAEYTVDRPVASAKLAEWTEDGWRLTDYKAGPWPVPFARSAHRLAPGLLPPVVRTNGDSGSVEGLAALWGGSFATVGGGWNAPLTAGLGLTTHRGQRGRVLRALAAYHDGDLEPVVYGDIDVGRQMHVRGHVEHPMTSEVWGLRRLESGGLLRDWRRSDVGVSASAGAHSLQLSGSVFSDARQPDDIWVGRLSYGTVFRQGRFTRWTLDFEHDSDRVESTRHSTTGVLGVQVPLGSPRRAWVTPGLDLVANYGAVEAARGLDASTTLLAHGTLTAGVALEGRLREVTHLVSPQVRLGGELGGLQQRQLREGAPEYPFSRPEGWRWATIALEQSLRQGDFSLRFPVGVFADALQGESIRDGIDDLAGFVRVAASLQRENSDGPTASIDAAAVCEGQCDEVSILISGRVRPFSAVRATYVVSDLSPRTATLLDADILLSHGYTALRLAQAGESGTMAHYASLQGSAGAAHGHVYGAYGRAGSSRGVGAELGWHFKSAGWGIAASGGYAVATSDWVAMAGLSMRR